jgi:polyferredoxin
MSYGKTLQLLILALPLALLLLLWQVYSGTLASNYWVGIATAIGVILLSVLALVLRQVRRPTP